MNDKINSLSSELSKKQEEILKYNNDIEKKEVDYKDKYDRFVADINDKNFDNNVKLIDLVAKYGENVIEDYKTNRIYDLLDNSFIGMSKEDVTRVLEDETLKNVLGNNLTHVLERYAK